MKAKSLICYKIGYNPDKKQKSKSVEVKEDGAKLIHVIPMVSGKKDLGFMINEQIPPYKELAMARVYTGSEKFHFFGQHCSGPFKTAWKNDLARNFRTNAVRTNPAFDRASIGIWIGFFIDKWICGRPH